MGKTRRRSGGKRRRRGGSVDSKGMDGTSGLDLRLNNDEFQKSAAERAGVGTTRDADGNKNMRAAQTVEASSGDDTYCIDMFNSLKGRYPNSAKKLVGQDPQCKGFVPPQEGGRRRRRHTKRHGKKSKKSKRRKSSKRRRRTRRY